MAKRIALLDIDPSKYYLMRRNIHGLGNTLWPCKVVCKDSHGWLRGYTNLSTDGKKIWVRPLGYDYDVELWVIREQDTLFVDDILENCDINYLEDKCQILQSQIEGLSRTLNVLQSINMGI